MSGHLLYSAATGRLLCDASSGHLLYGGPYGPSYTIGIAVTYRKRGLGSPWSLAYSNFLAAGWVSTSLQTLRTYNASTEVQMISGRCNTSLNNGKLYTKVDLNVTTYAPGSAAIYLSVISQADQNPPTSLGTIQAASKAQITGTGNQTFTLDSSFTMAAKTHIFVWEQAYQDPSPSTWQTHIDHTTAPVFHN